MIAELGDLIARLKKSDDAMDRDDANDIAHFAVTGDKQALRVLDTAVREMVFKELVSKRGKTVAEKLTGFKATF